MANDEPIDDDLEDVPEEELAEDDIDIDLDEDDVDVDVDVDEDVDVDVLVDDDLGDGVDDLDEVDPLAAPVAPVARAKAGSDDDEDEDEEEVDPDDVEEDLDTILKDRIAAGTDEDEEEDEDELATDDRGAEPGDRVSPRRPEESSCSECFLLVRASQFGSRKRDCPGGLDMGDCPMASVFAPAKKK